VLTSPGARGVDFRSGPRGMLHGRTHVMTDNRAPAAFAARVRPGWTRARLAAHLAAQGYRRGAEIGVADGRYSRVLWLHFDQRFDPR